MIMRLLMTCGQYGQIDNQAYIRIYINVKYKDMHPGLMIPVLGSQPAGDVCHKPGDRLSLLSARPAVTPATLRELLPILLLGEQRHDGCEQFT